MRYPNAYIPNKMIINLLIIVSIVLSILVIFGLYKGNRSLYNSEAYRTAKLFLNNDENILNLTGEIKGFKTMRNKGDEITFEGKIPVKAKYYFVVRGKVKKIEVKLELISLKNNLWEVSDVEFLQNSS